MVVKVSYMPQLCGMMTPLIEMDCSRGLHTGATGSSILATSMVQQGAVRLQAVARMRTHMVVRPVVALRDTVTLPRVTGTSWLWVKDEGRGGERRVDEGGEWVWCGGRCSAKRQGWQGGVDPGLECGDAVGW